MEVAEGQAVVGGDWHFAKMGMFLGTCDNILLSENTMLVGFAESVTTAATQQECIDNCLNSLRELGFECQSGTF